MTADDILTAMETLFSHLGAAVIGFFLGASAIIMLGNFPWDGNTMAFLGGVSGSLVPAIVAVAFPLALRNREQKRQRQAGLRRAYSVARHAEVWAKDCISRNETGIERPNSVELAGQIRGVLDDLEEIPDYFEGHPGFDDPLLDTISIMRYALSDARRGNDDVWKTLDACVTLFEMLNRELVKVGAKGGLLD